jgi:hypothetical protein
LNVKHLAVINGTHEPPFGNWRHFPNGGTG